MKKIFFFAIAALVMSACADNYADEQMEAVAVTMNKSDKTDKADVKAKGAAGNKKNQGIMLCKSAKTETAKVEKDPFAKGPDKNKKNGVDPCGEMATRSAALCMDDDQIVRHPTDGSSTSDKPANGGSSSTPTTKKSSGGFIPKPLK